MTYKEIQRAVITKYRITLCDGDCADGDWYRTHAHIRSRKVCKWVAKNSVQSTFELLHEIGHIETTTGTMRRAEEEYIATLWALKTAKEYGLKIPKKTLQDYADYIVEELGRGARRGGKYYSITKEIIYKNIMEL